MFDRPDPARRRNQPTGAPHSGRRICSGRLRAAASALVLAALTALVAALLPAASAGESLTSIQSRLHTARGKLDRVRGRERILSTDIAALSSRIRTLEREIGALRRRENKVERTLAAKRAQLERVKVRYAIEHARYVRLRARLRRAQIVLAERLVEIYKSDPPDFVTVILNADGFNDLLVRADYMSRIGEQDSLIVDRVRELKQASARKRRLLLDLREEAQATVDVIAAQEHDLEVARTGIESRQLDLAAARGQKHRTLVATRENRRELEAHIRGLEAASARVQAQLGGGGPVGAGPVRQGSGGFIWPVNGPVVSGYGMRWGRLHAGVDIAVPAGTGIRAAAGGRVAMAGWMGGYGQYTCIQHGGGVATCYAHQSSIGVSVGASVSQGQVIGAVGCTGHCFGDHLHFEVRVGGSPVDPMGYL
jgi:murein DD-endopeptidase MepM/ murein hydrolase activator NlpD